MAGFEVDISLDPERFSAAITDWSAKCEEEGHLASIDAAEFIKEELETELRKFPHLRAEPSMTVPFKGPPGLILDGPGAGDLSGGIKIEIMAVRGFVKVYPTARWSRIQEFGGWTGTDHMTYIPPRPYFRRTVESLDTFGPGGLEHIYKEHWLKAQMRAVAF